MASITTPVTVVAQPYDTSGNGGRKLVRLSNGWLVAAVSSGIDTIPDSKIYLYVSEDSGSSWRRLCYVGTASYLRSPSLAARNNTVYLLYSCNHSNNRHVSFNVIDATTQTDVDIFDNRIDIDQNQQTMGTCSLAIAPDGTLHAAWASKNSTYPNAFNLRYSKSTDGGQTWSAPEQVSKELSKYHIQAPCIILDSNNEPLIVHETNGGTNDFSIRVAKKTGLTTVSNYNWTYKVIYNGVNHAQSSPCAVVDNAGVIHVVWHGLDATDTTYNNIRYSSSPDGGVTWSNATKIFANAAARREYPSLTVDRYNELSLVFQNYNGGNYYAVQAKYDGVNWNTTNLEQTTTEPRPSVLYDRETDIVDPPVIYKTTFAVKFRGTWTTNQNPSITLTSPGDNQTLTEGNQLQLEGTAGDTDNGNIMTVKFQINNGPIRAIASGVSDGSTPISFARTLTYRNKRLWDGSTDVAGADLAEDVDHVLRVWAEDDQGGRSEEVVRHFRVIWNRPPVISGQNEDLGTIMEPPVRTYTVEDPEGNPFTITEKIDGRVIRTFSGVPGQEETVTIPHDMWIRLDLDVPHELTVEATDDNGLTSVRTFTFTRQETHIEFTLDFSNPAVAEHFTLDDRPKRVLVKLERYLPPGAEVEFVRVCNNALDDEPTWEDATAAVLAGRGHLFQNQQKTAENWRINIWVRIAKGTATERVHLDGYGGAFD